MDEPVILVVCRGDNMHGLQKLLFSFDQAKIPSGTMLYLSINGKATKETLKIAENWKWGFGKKEVVKRNKKLGHEEHILKASDEAAAKGNFFVFSDKDIVSPAFFQFGKAALEHFKDWDEIAAIQLKTIHENVHTGFPFSPVSAGHDVYLTGRFTKIPALWLSQKWLSFRNQANGEKLQSGHNKNHQKNNQNLSEIITQWLTKHNLFLAIPYFSYTCGNIEANQTQYPFRKLDFFASSASNEIYDRYPFQLEEAIRYDSWFELLPDCLVSLTGRWDNIDFTVDINGSKPLEDIKTPWLISSKLGKNPRGAFDMHYAPPEANIILNNTGTDVMMARTNSFSDGIFSWYHKRKVFEKLWKE